MPIDRHRRSARRANASRAGCFAALYRRVTQSVKHGIAAGRFQNGPLIDRLDVMFAVATFQARRQSTHSWAVALEPTSDHFPLILQQLWWA
jgi:endonuclease/exonuclease/phosphatase family metal-dependent hydrolase